MNRKLKLGTRKSLLAWAQSGWVARELERLNPGLSVELFGIETRGDRILDVSLQSVAGKEFFVAELDQALLSGAVDMSVHSMKDLSLDRPKELVCAAIPHRENPRDVILFGPGVREKIAAGRILKIGTSSPRRVENLPVFLGKALPTVGGQPPRVELVELRGNVNTRLSRVHLAEAEPKALDGVVLAMAGLIRLWADEPGRIELVKLLRNVRWMVMPLQECPTAPAQGALAVECRAADAEVREFLSKLHHPQTEKQVRRERQLLADWGGGCHQKFGATQITDRELGDLFYVRGVKADGQFVEDFQWNVPVKSNASEPCWDGSKERAEREGQELRFTSLRNEFAPGTAIFVAHARAVDEGWAEALNEARVWTSGTASWSALARLGVWVEGCAENRGYSCLEPVLSEPVLRLGDENAWTVLTHEAALTDWPNGKAMATYRLPAGSYSAESRLALKLARHIFWSSGSQWDELKLEVSPDARHACGPGKTAARLRAAGLKPSIFPSAKEWKKWLDPQKI